MKKIAIPLWATQKYLDFIPRCVESIENNFIPEVEKKLTQITQRQSATKYGGTNNKEWFAENFSLYEMGRKDIVDPRFIQFIEREM